MKGKKKKKKKKKSIVLLGLTRECCPFRSQAEYCTTEPPDTLPQVSSYHNLTHTIPMLLKLQRSRNPDAVTIKTLVILNTQNKNC